MAMAHLWLAWGKGYSRWLTLLVVIFPVGLIGLLLLPNRLRPARAGETAEGPERPSFNDTSPEAPR